MHKHQAHAAHPSSEQATPIKRLLSNHHPSESLLSTRTSCHNDLAIWYFSTFYGPVSRAVGMESQ